MVPIASAIFDRAMPRQPWASSPIFSDGYGGDKARDALFVAAYAELHGLAQARLRHGGRNALWTTRSPLHRSYLQFARAGRHRCQDRRAFFAYASHVMRLSVLVSVRERIALKRGGNPQYSDASRPLAGDLPGDEQTVLDVHEALKDLEQADPRLAEVAEDTAPGAIVRRKSPKRWNYRTHRAARLGKGTSDPCGGAAVSNEAVSTDC